MPKFDYGERNYPYRVSWKDTSKAGDDETGYKRGAIGEDGLLDADGELFMRTYDPAADAKAYGPSRPNGPWRTSSRSRDPGNLVDDGKGSCGVDNPNSRNRPDDGVRH